jgi:hypothetical protein
VRQENARLASDVLEDFVDGAGDVDRGRHAEEHDGGDDVRERGRVTGAGALGDSPSQPDSRTASRAC